MPSSLPNDCPWAFLVVIAKQSWTGNWALENPGWGRCSLPAFYRKHWRTKRLMFPVLFPKRRNSMLFVKDSTMYQAPFTWPFAGFRFRRSIRIKPGFRVRWQSGLVVISVMAFKSSAGNFNSFFSAFSTLKIVKRTRFSLGTILRTAR